MMSMILWDCVLERLKENQIVDRVVGFCNQYHPIKMVAQKDRGNELDFDLAIRKRANIRGVALPYIRWTPTNIGNVPLQKATRIKKLELPLGQDLLWFAQGPYDIDAVFEQFIKVGGGAWKKSSSRHDDVPDGISLAYEHFFPKMLTEPEDAKTRQQREDDAAEEYRRAALADHHSRMFSDYVPSQPTTRTQYEKQQRGEDSRRHQNRAQHQHQHPCTAQDQSVAAVSRSCQVAFALGIRKIETRGRSPVRVKASNRPNPEVILKENNVETKTVTLTESQSTESSTL